MSGAILGVGAAFAVAVGSSLLSFSAYTLLEDRVGPAGASAIVGLVWLLAGAGYFAATRRRRN